MCGAAARFPLAAGAAQAALTPAHPPSRPPAQLAAPPLRVALRRGSHPRPRPASLARLPPGDFMADTLLRRLRWPAMTHSPRSTPHAPTPSAIECIAEDLRRQRADLERQRRDAGTSSAVTASLLQKIEELRRRSEALTANDNQNRS